MILFTFAIFSEKQFFSAAKKKFGGGNLKKPKNCFSDGSGVAISAFFLEMGSSFVVKLHQYVYV